MGRINPVAKKTVPRHYLLNKHRMRYWLANGAQPTRGVKKFLEKYEFVPPLKAPFGEKHKVEYKRDGSLMWGKWKGLSLTKRTPKHKIEFHYR